MKTIVFSFGFTFFISSMFAQSVINTDTIGHLSKTDNLYVKNISSDSLCSGFIILIKKEVKLHKHLQHSEHVVVLDGEAEFILGDKKFNIKKGDVIFIPKNTPHKVITTSKKPLKVISIQSPYFDGKDREMLE
ncbi:MAG: cupin domain-containing protein [Bacteroidota bacterium]